MTYFVVMRGGQPVGSRPTRETARALATVESERSRDVVAVQEFGSHGPMGRPEVFTPSIDTAPSAWPEEWHVTLHATMGTLAGCGLSLQACPWCRAVVVEDHMPEHLAAAHPPRRRLTRPLLALVAAGLLILALAVFVADARAGIPAGTMCRVTADTVTGPRVCREPVRRFVRLARKLDASGLDTATCSRAYVPRARWRCEAFMSSGAIVRGEVRERSARAWRSAS